MNIINIHRLATPFVIWFTGLPCSGKSTLAEGLRDYLASCSIPVEYLDGDTVRKALGTAGFSAEERNAHIRNMGFLAAKLEKHGIPVIASFVSPYHESREFSRKLCQHFIEVYVATPLEVCEKRDVKGMYQKARSGALTQFTGIDDPYEAPTAAEMSIDTTERAPDECVSQIIAYLIQHGALEPAER